MQLPVIIVLCVQYGATCSCNGAPGYEWTCLNNRSRMPYQRGVLWVGGWVGGWLGGGGWD